MPSEPPIIIAGGGPVGVVTALALARQGLEVRLFRPTPASMTVPARQPPMQRPSRCWKRSASSKR